MSLGAPILTFGSEDGFASMAAMVGLGIFGLVVVYGIPLGLLKLLKWGFSLFLAQGEPDGGREGHGAVPRARAESKGSAGGSRHEPQ